LKSSPLKVMTPVVLALPRVRAPVVPGVVPLTTPTPTSPDRVTPPVFAAATAAFISRVVRASDVDIVTGSGLTTIGGNIGTTLALTTLDINAAVAAANTGGVTLSGDVGVGVVSGTTPGTTGALTLGNANTTGVITLSGEDFNTGGAITFTGGSYTVANGSTALTIVTSNDAVDFNAGTVTVGNNAFNIDTDTTGTGTGANITFDGKILGDTTLVTGSAVMSDLSFDAGAGTATVTVTDIGYNGTTDVNEINSVALTGGTISTNGRRPK
jgi:hypothetical protein